MTGQAERTQGETHLAFWRLRLNSPSFVYVIQGEKGTPVKIGTARDPQRRLAGLQTGSYQTLRLLHVLPGDRHLEATFHQRVAADHVLGEWYQGPAADRFIDFARRLADRMVEHYDGTGIAPGLQPEDIEKLEPPVFVRDRWRRIGDMWLAGKARWQIAQVMKMTEDRLEIEILRMRAEGGYELAEGLEIIGPRSMHDPTIRRTGNFRKLGLHRPKPRPEPTPVKVRFVEPNPVQPLTPEEQQRAVVLGIAPSDYRRMKHMASAV